MSFLVCSVTLKLPTPNPRDLAHTQAIESFSEAPLFPNIFPHWIITEPVKQVYHDGHKCDLIIQSYFRRSFKSYIFSTVENIFTYSFFSCVFLTFKQCLSISTIIVKQINYMGDLSYQKGVQKFCGEKAVWCKRWIYITIQG